MRSFSTRPCAVPIYEHPLWNRIETVDTYIHMEPPPPPPPPPPSPPAALGYFPVSITEWFKCNETYTFKGIYAKVAIGWLIGEACLERLYNR